MRDGLAAADATGGGCDDAASCIWRERLTADDGVSLAELGSCLVMATY